MNPGSFCGTVNIGTPFLPRVRSEAATAQLMFAINHAATALIIKKRYRTAPLAWLLVSVQVVEMLWVVLNLMGIERTSTEADVASVSDIHLEYMPYSHSLVSSLVIALIAWLLLEKWATRRIAIAVAIGIVSHIVLDILTHVPDIAIVPFVFEQKLGVGLYSMPLAAFVVETAYGAACWWLFRGNAALLATIVAFNLANLSFFVAALPGPETLMAGHPLWIVGAVGAQIVVTLALVGIFARPTAKALERQIA